VVLEMSKNDVAIILKEANAIQENKAVYKKLYDAVNELIQNDFPQLINLLYRFDISEKKLKQMLQNHTDADAAAIIANLLIERELQKIKTRREYNRQDNNISDEEKW
ncbi:MAG: hypothetical protein ACK5NK_03235, partial [Niabella sp.]